MADRQTSSGLIAEIEVTAHGSYRMYKDFQRKLVTDDIKAENRADDLSGQGHRQENEDSLFLIGRPALDIKDLREENYKMKGGMF